MDADGLHHVVVLLSKNIQTVMDKMSCGCTCSLILADKSPRCGVMVPVAVCINICTAFAGIKQVSQLKSLSPFVDENMEPLTAHWGL